MGNAFLRGGKAYWKLEKFSFSIIRHERRETEMYMITSSRKNRLDRKETISNKNKKLLREMMNFTLIIHIQLMHFFLCVINVMCESKKVFLRQQ